MFQTPAVEGATFLIRMLGSTPLASHLLFLPHCGLDSSDLLVVLELGGAPPAIRTSCQNSQGLQLTMQLLFLLWILHATSELR